MPDQVSGIFIKGGIMTIKDIIKLSATMLNREDVIDYLEKGTATGDALECIDTLTRCANLTINELAGSYIFMQKEEGISGEIIKYTDLSETILKVIKVLDASGNKIKFKMMPEYVKLSSFGAKIIYNYLPSNYGLEDIIGYTEKDISSRIIAYGVVAEYCLVVHAFSESVMWHQRFIDGIEGKCYPKNSKIKSREFV